MWVHATISAFSKDGLVKDAVVVLKTPKFEGGKLMFDVQTLEGDVSSGDGGATLFIDIIGRSASPGPSIRAKNRSDSAPVRR